MHDLLFENQSHLKRNQLGSYAEKLELDMPRYDLELDDEVYLQRVREHIEGAKAWAAVVGNDGVRHECLEQAGEPRSIVHHLHGAGGIRPGQRARNQVRVAGILLQDEQSQALPFGSTHVV
jgi:hypothetical protein